MISVLVMVDSLYVTIFVIGVYMIIDFVVVIGIDHMWRANGGHMHRSRDR